MNTWTFLFILLGVCFLTAQIFRLIDAIEHSGRRSHRRITARG